MANNGYTEGSDEDPAEVLYHRLCKFIEDHVRSNSVHATLAKQQLQEFIAVWLAYKMLSKWIYALFMHLEINVIKLSDLLSLTSVALVQFKKHIYDRHKNNLAEQFMVAVLKEREGELIDISLMQDALQVSLGTVASYFTLYLWNTQ